jgi:hypothetical protein
VLCAQMEQLQIQEAHPTPKTQDIHRLIHNIPMKRKNDNRECVAPTKAVLARVSLIT